MFLNEICTLEEGHTTMHESINNQKWPLNIQYIECGHVNLYDSKFICTRVKGHYGQHENDKGISWGIDLDKVYIEKEEVKEFSGVTSTKIPRFELIPFFTLCLFAGAFEEGIRKKNEGAWNALNAHLEEALKDKLFVVERLSHVIKHCYKAIGKVMEGKEWEGEEDAGAIMFGGSVLAEYKRLRRDE